MSIPVHRPPRRAAVRWLAPAALAAAAGCQTYERAPLDLEAHRAAIGRRATDEEPLAAFVARLREQGRTTPERFALADGVTCAEGEMVALFHNADLRLARLEAGVAEAHAETAGLWSDPELGFDGAEILSSSAPFEFGITLGLTLPVSGRLAVERDRAWAAHAAELARVAEREWTVRAALRRAWAAWSIAAERTRQLETLLARVADIDALVARLADAGEIGRVEARLFAVEHAQRRAELARARATEVRLRSEVLGLMGLTEDAPLELEAGIPTPADDAIASARDADLAERNPALAVRRAEHDAAEDALRLEVRKQYPDIVLGGGYGEEDDRRVLLGVSLPIPLWNANRAGIADARARRALAAAAAETTLERVRRELAAARRELAAVRAERDAVEHEVVPLLAAQEEEIVAIARVGEVDALLLLESVTRRHEARMRILDLRLEEHDAAVRVATLLGPTSAAETAPTPTRDDDRAFRAEETAR